MGKDPTEKAKKDLEAVSDEMRRFTQSSVEQARGAFNDFMKATAKAMDQAEASTQALQNDARKLSMGSVDYAQKSLEQSFAFAARLAQAKNMNEVLELQKTYLEDQFRAAKAEMQRVSETATRMASEFTTKRK